MRRLLLCPPDHYGIEYEINPWMSRARGADSRSDKGAVERTVRETFESRLQDRAGPAAAETSRHGLHRQRRTHHREEVYPEQFSARGTLRRSAAFRALDEGARLRSDLACRRIFTSKGKATRSSRGDALFCGYKFRSDINSHRAVADILGCLVISVELVDPRFYHLDTCFSSVAGWRRGLVSGGV